MKIRIGLLVLLPFLWLAPLLNDLGQIHYAPGGEFSDLAIAHVPSAELLRQTLARYGEIPLWNPDTLGGTPFSADPLSGLYYPPLWLALVLPAPLAFNLLFLAHLAFAGVGAYLLARGEGAGQTGALLAGIAFGGLPKLAAHAGAGHLTLVLAVSWTPWLLLVARRAALSRSVRGWSLAGVVAGIIFLADPRWAIPSALAAAGYAVVSAGKIQTASSRKSEFIYWVRRFAVFGVFAVAMTAVLALPMAEFVSLSTRATIAGSDAAANSLPFIALLGLVNGASTRSWEWVVYPGAAVLVLAAASFPGFLRRRPVKVAETPAEAAGADEGEKNRSTYWFGIFILCVFLSLGSSVPGLAQFMDAIPALNLLRVPPRWMFLAGLALAMLAPRGLARLEGAPGGGGILRKAGFALAAGGLTLAVASGVMGLHPTLWQGGLVWGAAGLILFAGFSSGRWAAWASLALVGQTVVDLAVADQRFIDPTPTDPVAAEAAYAASSLSPDGREFRVYSPSYSIPQSAAIRYGLRTLDGIDPLILQSTADVVSAASGVPYDYYSVTLPPFTNAEPESDNRDASPDGRRLGLLNVRFVASAFPVSGRAFRRLDSPAGIFLYENLLAAPRAWVTDSADNWDFTAGTRGVRVEFESPNRLRLSASGPGIVVISEAAYPAWRATVDGESAELLTVGGWWRAVEIGPGDHTVELRYDPSLSLIGLAVTALALAAFLGVQRWAP